MKKALTILLVLIAMGAGLLFAFTNQETIVNFADNLTAKNYLELVFVGIIAMFLIVDLGWLNRKAHTISATNAGLQTLFWIAVAAIFGLGIYQYVGTDTATEFYTAFITEKMLSVDNLFVILLLFQFFRIDPKYHHRVLFWGILGAVVFRGVFIGAGAALVAQFHWILYLFAVWLIWTGYKIIRGEEDENNFEENAVYRLAHRYLPITEEHHGHFFRKIDGKTHVTLLFVVLLLVETTDVIFAIGSIPAGFGISKDPFVLYTSNIFAVMGLRALYFFIEAIIAKFHHLSKGIATILIFIGIKMLVDIVDIHISSYLSLAIIVGILGISMIASLMLPKDTDETKATTEPLPDPKPETE